MSELMLALEQIEKEKGISKDIIIEAIEKSLLDACKKDFGKSDWQQKKLWTKLWMMQLRFH